MRLSYPPQIRCLQLGRNPPLANLNIEIFFYKVLYFKDIIKLLNQIQSIKDKKIKNFRNKYYRIPDYKNEILIQEANLFCEWYVKKNLTKNKRKNFNK